VFLWFTCFRLRRKWLIIASCLALFAGIVFARYNQQQNARFILLLVPLTIISLRSHSATTLLLLCVLAFGMGWWRGSVFLQRLAVNNYLYDQKVTVIGQG
jgi:hypothetical protein